MAKAWGTIYILIAIGLIGCSSGGTGNTIPDPPANPLTPTINVSGSWEGTFADGGTTHYIALNLNQSNTNLSGTYNDTTTSGSGSISGVVSANSVYFTIASGCSSKTIKGFGTGCNNTISFNIQGADCSRQYNSSGKIELFDSYAGTWTSALSSVLGSDGQIYQIASQVTLTAIGSDSYSGTINFTDAENSTMTGQISSVPISADTFWGTPNVVFSTVTGTFLQYSTVSGILNSKCCVPPRELSGIWTFNNNLTLSKGYKRSSTCK